MATKIVITGVSGQLGSALCALWRVSEHYEIIPLHRERVDFLTANWDEVFRGLNADYCINCAAYTKVDDAERDTDTAYFVNAVSVGMIAQACEKYRVKLVHISTDYVFNGKKQSPYTEQDQPNPLNIYGRSKYEGERLALTYTKALILRVSWLYSVMGRNFLLTMHKLLANQTPVRVVDDQIGCPTYAFDVARVISQIIQADRQGMNHIWGEIYHFSNRFSCSWYDFACEIRRLMNTTTAIQPVSSDVYGSIVERPPYSVLCQDKIRSDFGICARPWTDALAQAYEHLTFS